MIGLLNKPLLICQSGEKEIQNASSNLLSPLGEGNKDISAASQTLVTGFRLHLQ